MKVVGRCLSDGLRVRTGMFRADVTEQSCLHLGDTITCAVHQGRYRQSQLLLHVTLAKLLLFKAFHPFSMHMPGCLEMSQICNLQSALLHVHATDQLKTCSITGRMPAQNASAACLHVGSTAQILPHYAC